MTFSFVTITYNHEQFIIQHLESIKFQIATYGAGISCELVISDDCSTDSTMELVAKWTEHNKNLFSGVSLLRSDRNQGIVNNYTRALTSFSGDFFKVLAGDDAFTTFNIFECIELLSEYDIVQTGLLEFERETVKTQKEFFRYLVDFRNTSLDKMRRHSNFGKFILRAPAFFFRKEFITPELIAFLAGYKMCEDMPLFYYLFNKARSFKFIEKPYILYRISVSSLARNKAHKSNSILITDNINFCRFLISRTNNINYRLHLQYKIHIYNKSPWRFVYKFNYYTLYFKALHFVNDLKYARYVEERTASNTIIGKEEEKKINSLTK